MVAAAEVAAAARVGERDAVIAVTVAVAVDAAVADVAAEAEDAVVAAMTSATAARIDGGGGGVRRVDAERRALMHRSRRSDVLPVNGTDTAAAGG